MYALFFIRICIFFMILMALDQRFMIYNLMSDKIIGVQRTLTDIGPLAKWNKKRLRWIITHNTFTLTRQHTIDLQMVIVSSQRVIKVDNEVKHTSMIFGFKQQFDISPRLKGKIQQEGLTFQLYVNGESFTNLSQKQYGYQPIKFDPEFFEPKKQSQISSNNNGIKPANNPFVFKQQLKKQTPNQSKPVEKTNKFVLKEPPKTQDALKSAQDQLMRIMIEQKRRKKEMQAQKINT